MNDVIDRRASVEARLLDAQRDKTLARFEDHMRELAVSPPLERVAWLDKELHLLEQYARDTGLFRDPEMLEFRIGRLVTRWHLGERLAKVEREPGKRTDLLPSGSRLKTVKETTGLVDREVQAAQRIARLPPSELEAFCKRAREVSADGQLPTFAELLRLARPWWYQESRREKHRAIHRRAKLSSEQMGPFPLIYADPPWRFDVYSDKGLERTPDQHYPTLSYEEIRDYKVRGKLVSEIAEQTAALLMWCTSSNVHFALEIMEAWDFEFKTSAVWVKAERPDDDEALTRFGLGLVFRNMHEVLLYGTRGDMPGPQYQPPSAFFYPRGKHSAKPPEIRAEIERMYPDFDAETRLEIFARGDILGWTLDGYEAG